MSLKLMLFTTDLGCAKEAEEAGVDRIVVDLEKYHKQERQQGYHLEVNDNSIDDLSKIRRGVSTQVLCRINSMHKGSRSEIEEVLDLGVDVIMLPYFRHIDEVKDFLDIVDGRVVTNVLFETKEAVEYAQNFCKLKFDEFYVGLNDLRISLGRKFAYEFVADGTVDRLKKLLPNKPFGVGGITVLDKGTPLSSKHILKELCRLRSSLVILRRAFRRDVAGMNFAEEVHRIKSFYSEQLNRDELTIDADSASFVKQVNRILMSSS